MRSWQLFGHLRARPKCVLFLRRYRLRFTSQDTATHYNTLQHNVMHTIQAVLKALQTQEHTATHCNTLQHTQCTWSLRRCWLKNEWVMSQMSHIRMNESCHNVTHTNEWVMSQMSHIRMTHLTHVIRHVTPLMSHSHTSYVTHVISHVTHLISHVTLRLLILNAPNWVTVCGAFPGPTGGGGNQLALNELTLNELTLNELSLNESSHTHGRVMSHESSHTHGRVMSHVISHTWTSHVTCVN